MQAVAHIIQHSDPLLLYLAVAVVLMLESSGVPIANTTVLLFTGAMASLGHMDIAILGGAALAGSITGACIAYVLGERGGRRLLLRFVSFLRIDARKVVIVERWFQRSGIWMIFFSRMLPYVRPFACYPAGISRMPFSHFSIAALLGSAVWCFSMLTVGWNLGKRWTLALTAIQTYTLPTLLAAALLIVIYVVAMVSVKRYLRRRFEVSEAVECERRSIRDLLEV